MKIKVTYKGRPASIIKHFRGWHFLRYCPEDGKPWERVAIGSRTYLRELCD